MKNIVNTLTAVFNQMPFLTKGLDSDKSYLMVISVNDQNQYLLETYLQVTATRDPEDTAHHAVDPQALVENYTNVPEMRKLLPGQKSGFIGSLSRFDIGNHPTQLWLLYKEGTFTRMDKGLVYLASIVVQKHYMTFIRCQETNKLTVKLEEQQIKKWVPPTRIGDSERTRRRKLARERQAVA